MTKLRGTGSREQAQCSWNIDTMDEVYDPLSSDVCVNITTLQHLSGMDTKQSIWNICMLRISRLRTFLYQRRLYWYAESEHAASRVHAWIDRKRACENLWRWMNYKRPEEGSRHIFMEHRLDGWIAGCVRRNITEGLPQPGQPATCTKA